MLRAIVILLIAALLAWRITEAVSSADRGDAYPSRPVHVVVPYTAGGGTDTFARIIQGAIAGQNLLPQPLVIQNQPGGSGTIGSRYVKNAPPDGYKILCHHESIITANVSGTVAFGPGAFAPIAQTGNIVLLILVRGDAPYQSVTDLLEHARKAPGTINFGANVGSPGHFTGMQLEEAHPGARLNFITSGGGQKRFTQLIGGHLQAGIFSLAEYRAFRAANDTPPDRNIRALAILEPERHPELPDVPTCREAGLDVTSSNAFYWWAPKDTPPDVVDLLATALERAMASEAVRADLAKLAIGPVFRRGADLRSHLDERVAIISQLDVRSETQLPDFPLITALIVAALLLVVAADSLRQA
ncbi:MAG: tripartite tricarboxylate transporter substrate binding protein, partial [Akkermansiaceae bacterium]|nr:tripartite tricarboxylate transporter substrate binding protein [Akkermansiaceae bacterium]